MERLAVHCRERAQLFSPMRERAELRRLIDEGVMPRGARYSDMEAQFASGQVVGYFSVRRKASAKAIALMGDVYRAMLEEERKAGAKDACTASLALLARTLEQQGVSYEQLVLSL